jgi:hypothetical protein
MPSSRFVEYASKLVAWRKIENPQPAPRGPFDHRCRGLVLGGATEAVPFVAADNADRVIEAARNGVPIYLDTNPFLNGPAAPHIKALSQRFDFVRCAPWLCRLVLREDLPPETAAPPSRATLPTP